MYLGVGPSDTRLGFVFFCKLQGHGSTVVRNSLATQKMTNYPQIKGVVVAM
jgi:hypothetical protein